MGIATQGLLIAFVVGRDGIRLRDRVCLDCQVDGSPGVGA